MVKQLNTNKNMKTRILLLMLSAWLLTGTMLFAQNSGTQKGDVNRDGVINEQDVPALIKIMRDGGGVRKPTTYYWYVGQTDPSTMTEISPIVTDKTSPGWRLIGTELPNYNISNKLYDSTQNSIVWDTKSIPYIIVPKDANINMYDGLGNNITNSYIKGNDVEFNNVKYDVYTGQVAVKGFYALLY